MNPHKGFVFNADVKCVVCWTYCGPNAEMNRCKKCIGFSREFCRKCPMAIKIKNDEIDEFDDLCCNYCGGEHNRICDGTYQTYSDYDTKYRIRNLPDNQINIIVCRECFVPTNSSTEIVNEYVKCDMCNKYHNNSANIEKDYFLRTTKNANSIYTDT